MIGIQSSFSPSSEFQNILNSVDFFLVVDLYMKSNPIAALAIDSAFFGEGFVSSELAPFQVTSVEKQTYRVKESVS